MITAPKGTRDIYSREAAAWRRLEGIIHKLCEAYGYMEIRTPVFEAAELFQRGMGETTDVVQKEMYVFSDKGGRLNALRPEGTAGAARAFIEHGMASMPQPVKMYYVCPLFRQEKPQAGRYRQFHSFGAEAFGSPEPACDAEIISLAHELLRRLGVTDVRLHLNSLGCPECRPKYNVTLKAYIGKHLDALCDTCKSRYEKNPLRALDCKESSCKCIMEAAPSTMDYLDESCLAHFNELRKLLDAMGISYVINDRIVRGLDYYTRTVFEYIYEGDNSAIGAQNTVCGGGRYDKLVEELNGPSTPAMGFGIGLDRIILAMGGQEAFSGNVKKGCDIFIGSVGEAGFLKAQELTFKLRSLGVCAVSDTFKRSVKAQMKYADKQNAAYSVILGDDEISSGTCSLRRMDTGETISTEIGGIINIIGKEASNE